jgi:hypothetical protein
LPGRGIFQFYQVQLTSWCTWFDTAFGVVTDDALAGDQRLIVG